MCDPSVVKVGGYYYMAYTGAPSDTTYSNDHWVFLARSTSPNSGFVKWNGTGWGGQPEPIIVPARMTGYAIGQPSLVIKDGVMYVFYECHARDIWQTRLSTAPLGADPASWPTRLQNRGVVLEHPGFDLSTTCGGNALAESTDVTYSDQAGRFMAVTTNAATFKYSALQTWESTDGLDFTQAITQTVEHQHYPRDPGLTVDQQGHLDTSSNGAMAYSYGNPGCGASRTRWNGIASPTAPTGSINEPLTTTATDWQPRSGDWAIVNGSYKQRQFGLDYAYSTLSQGRIGASTTIDFYVNVRPLVSPVGGVQFGQTLLADTYLDSGYLLAYGVDFVELWKGDQLLSRVRSPYCFNGDKYFAHVRVVTSNGNIYVYAEARSGCGSLVTPLITAADADDPYLGGYVGLVATDGGTPSFTDFKITDNSVAPYANNDWGQDTGMWTRVGTNTFLAQASENKIYRQNDDPTGQHMASFGDGGYTATIRLGGGSDPDAWGGVNIANAGLSPDWGAGGYLVFIRRNGNVGVFKAGFGQIIADVPTDADPVAAPVRLRILKSGGAVQVYLDDDTTPVVNFWDHLPGTPLIGGWGLATRGATGTFTNVKYAANYGV